MAYIVASARAVQNPPIAGTGTSIALGSLISALACAEMMAETLPAYSVHDLTEEYTKYVLALVR